MVTAVGLVREAVARAREQQQRRAQTASEQRARELQSPLDAERRAARAELAAVHQPDWRNRATPEQIGRAYQTAQAWSVEEPEAVRAEQRISQELRIPYGVDAAHAGADTAAVRAAFQRARRDRAPATIGRSDAAVDQAEATVLLTLADAHDRRADQDRGAAARESDPDVRADAPTQAEDTQDAAEAARRSGKALYDSAERREQTARELEARGIGEAATSARMSADVSQARPAPATVGGPMSTRPSTARRTHTRGAQVQRATAER